MRTRQTDFERIPSLGLMQPLDSTRILKIQLVNNNNKKKKKKVKRGRSAPKRRERKQLVARPISRTVSVPASYGRVYKQAPPMMGTRIRHCEYVAAFPGSTSAAPTAPVLGENYFEINPGLPLSFPWLSSIAKNFEFYKFNRLSFMYVNAISTDQPGSVFMVPEYDINDAAPLTVAQVFNTTGAVSSNVWLGLEAKINCRANGLSNLRKKVRASGVTGDHTLYDVANLSVGTLSGSSGASPGRLMVCYDIELYTPQTSSQTDVASERTIAHSSGSTLVSGAAGSAQPITLNSLANGLRMAQQSANHLEFKNAGAVVVDYAAELLSDGTAGTFLGSVYSQLSTDGGTTWTTITESLSNFESIPNGIANLGRTFGLTVTAGSLIRLVAQNTGAKNGFMRVADLAFAYA